MVRDWIFLFYHMATRHGLTRTDIDLKHMELGHYFQHRQPQDHEEADV